MTALEEFITSLERKLQRSTGRIDILLGHSVLEWQRIVDDYREQQEAQIIALGVKE